VDDEVDPQAGCGADRAGAPDIGGHGRGRAAGGGLQPSGHAKTIEGKQSPDRDAQFRYINGQVAGHLAAEQPVISVDTKKKEKVWAALRSGRPGRLAAPPRPAQRDPGRPGDRHAPGSRARAGTTACRPHPALAAKQLKELRLGCAGRSEIRILYIFDSRRSAVLLVAGDKAGKWEAWYRQAIPLAEQRYEDYLKSEGTR